MAVIGGSGWLVALAVVSAVGQAGPGQLGPGQTGPGQGGARPTLAPTHADLPYVTNGSPAQRLDLYLPAGKRNLPTVVFIHGGAFQFGDRRPGNLPTWVVSKEYALASIDYRLTSEAKFPAALEDAKSAIRFLRARANDYGLDARRIVVWGESAGGHIASMVGTTNATKAFDVGENLTESSGVQGVITYFGPSDFLKLDTDTLPGSDKHLTDDSPEAKYLGVNPAKDPALARRANPIPYIGPRTPPFLLVHGTDDRQVSFGQSQLLFDALRKASRPATMFPVEGAGHLFRGATPAQLAEIRTETETFLREIFKS